MRDAPAFPCAAERRAEIAALDAAIAEAAAMLGRLRDDTRGHLLVETELDFGPPLLLALPAPLLRGHLEERIEAMRRTARWMTEEVRLLDAAGTDALARATAGFCGIGGV